MTSAEQARSVARTANLRSVVPGGGFDRAVSLNAAAVGVDISPFVDLTMFDMTLPVFRPHPHAGFSAVTYMFEESPGSFRNRWTSGPDEVIGPGAIHWTRAGSGMMHEEVPTVSGVPCRGVQMFVKLHPDHELDEPKAFHLDADEIDEVPLAGGGRVRVLAGRHAGVVSRLGVPDEVTLLDVHLAPDGAVELNAAAAWNAFVLLRSGSIEVGGRELLANSAATFHSDGDTVRLRSRTGAQLLFGTGRHAGPEVAAGSFILSTRERLADAQRRFAEGAMGDLEPSF